MIIYGLDLSIAQTGIAVYKEDDGIIHLETIRTQKQGDNTPQRLRQIRMELENLKEKYPPSVVVLEQGFIRHNKASQQIFRVFGITEELFADVPIYHYTPNSVKKHSTGDGHAKKQKVRECVEEHFDIKANNYDESDAMGVILTYLKQEVEQ